MNKKNLTTFPMFGKLNVILFVLLITRTTTSEATPVNDQPCNAIVIPVNGITYFYDNIDATTDIDEVVPPAGTNPDGSCISRDGWCTSDLSADNTVWFTFIAPASGMVTISSCHPLTVIDNQIAVYTAGDCADYNTFTLIGANDDAPTGCQSAFDAVSILYLSGLIPGNSYYIQVDGYIGDTGLFGISITESFANTNDDICNALSISLSATPFCGDNFFASAAQGEPAGINWANGDGVQNSVWFKFTAPASGKVYFSTSHSNTTFDTQIAIYASSDNTCNGTLTELASDDDSGSINAVTSETSVVCLRPGNTYFIQVDGFMGAFGAFCLTANDTAVTTGLTPSITAAVSEVCEGATFTVTSTATGGTPGIGPTVTGSNSNPFSIPDASPTGISSPITLSGSTGNVTPTGVINVTLNITHTYVSDLYIYLIGPGNCGALELSTANGGSGDNYINTILSTAATNIIGSAGNNTAPFTGTYRPEGTIATPPASNTFSIPTAPINGCPISGTWTLRVIDAVGGDVGTLQNWSLSVAESYYQHAITGPGAIQIATSGTNNQTAIGTVRNAPPGKHAYITHITDVTGCTVADTVFVKVFDIPDIVDVSTRCVTGNDGIITINATIDNANFTGSDIGTIEYSFDGGNTWSTSNTSSGYAIGTYLIGVRNSAKPDCFRLGFVTLQTAPLLTVNNTSPVCEGNDVGITGSAIGGNQFTNSGNAAPNTTIPDNNRNGITSVIPIIGIGNIQTNSIVSVTLNITHSWVGDLHVYLVGPNNCGTLELTTNNGGSGDNYTNTVLNTSASVPITSGIPPFTGTYLPQGTITGTNNNTLGLPTNGILGCPINGNWTLHVYDLAAGDIGTLLNWSISLTRTGNLLHSVSGNGTIGPITYSGVNNANGSLTVSDLPIGANQFIYTITALSGCTISDTFNINVFDIPVIDSLTTECSSGADGTIFVIGPPLNNANFSGSNVGIIEYSYDNGNTWTSNNPETGFAPGNYNVYVRNSAYPVCQSGPQPAEVLYAPGADAGPDQDICSDGIAALTASGGDNYLWSTGETTASIIVSPTVSTIYIVTVTAANGCTSTDDVAVNVLPPLNPDLGPDFSLCEGASATLTAQAGTSFLWSTGATTASIIVTPLINTTYSVTVSDANGCTGTDSITITIVQSIDPNLPATVNICSGSATTLTASGGGSYLWSTGATTASITVSPTTNTTYSVTVTNAGCTATASTLVTVTPLPNPNLPATVNICSGSTATLTASGGGSYLWNTGQTSASITVSPTTNTTYSVTVTNAGCTATASTLVTVTPLPNPNLPATVNICSGSTATLTASGGGSYLWNTGQTSASITVSPTTNTTYSVTVTNAGCTATASTLVTVTPLPNPNLPATVNICSGSTATLTASGGGSYLWNTGQTSASITVSPTTNTTYSVTVTNAGCTATASTLVTVTPLPNPNLPATVNICSGSAATLTASGGGSYLWSTGQTSASITVSPTTNTTYSVTVTNAGCSATASTQVVVNATPVVNIPDQQICAGSSVTLDAGNPGAVYLWSNNATSQTITVSAAGVYSVTVTLNGCTATDAATISFGGTLNVSLPQVVAFCTGDSVALDAGNPGADYLWSTGATTQVIYVTSGGLVSVTVTGQNGCIGTAATTVIENPIPPADAGPSQTICPGGVATLVASGGASYLWSNGAQGAINIVNPLQTTTYYVTVTSSSGCQSEDSVTVTVLPPPSITLSNDTTVCAFTPVTLTAAGGVTYLWNTNATAAAITVTPVNSTTYSVTVTDANGCTASASVNVTTLPLPNANAGADVGICEGSTVTIYGSGNGSFQWSNGSTSSSLTVSPVTTTVYELTVTNANGCSRTDNVTVFVNPLPQVSVSMTNSSFCINDAPVNVSVSPPGGNLTGSGISGNTFSPSAAGVGNHIISYSYTDNNQCTATDYLAVTVDACNGIDELFQSLKSAQVFPNPFINHINIKFNSSTEDKIEIKLTDIIGQEYLNETISVRMGENIYQIQVGSELAGGMYFIELKKAERLAVFRLFRLQ